MEVVNIVDTILESLLAFVIRVGLWFFVAALAPTWVAALVLIVIILIPVFTVVLEDILDFYQPAADLTLALTAFLSNHGIFNWQVSLALVALFGLPLVFNVYL